MANQKGYVQQHAMKFGTYLGLFWVAKFPLFPLGLNTSLLLLLFIVLTAWGPFLGYRFVKSFREQVCNGHIGFFTAYRFTLSMYLFAALFTSMAHFVYFSYIDHGYILDTYGSLLQQIGATDEVLPAGYAKELSGMLKELKALTPFEIVLQLISQNVCYGALLALPTALFATQPNKK